MQTRKLIKETIGIEHSEVLTPVRIH